MKRKREEISLNVHHEGELRSLTIFNHRNLDSVRFGVKSFFGKTIEMEAPEILFKDEDGNEIKNIDELLNLNDAYFEENGKGLKMLFSPGNLLKNGENIGKELKYEHKETFTLPKIYLENSGLPSENPIQLYCRPSFVDLFKFLQERVVDNKIHGWIMGPPGCGICLLLIFHQEKAQPAWHSQAH